MGQDFPIASTRKVPTGLLEASMTAGDVSAGTDGDTTRFAFIAADGTVRRTERTSAKGAPNGYASLDSATSVPAAQLGNAMLAGISSPGTATLTNNTNRTPSTTRPTWVVCIVDYNTLAASTQRSITVTVGATTYPYVTISNDAVGAFQRAVAVPIGLVPANTAYKVNCTSTTNLTLTAQEVTL